MTGEQRANQMGFTFDPSSGQYTRLRGSLGTTGTGTYRETRDPQFFEPSLDNRGRAQFGSALMADYMAQARAAGLNYQNAMDAIANYRTGVDEEYNRLIGVGDQAYSDAEAKGDEFFDFGQMVYDRATSRAEDIESQFDDYSAAQASSISMGQQRQARSQLSQLDAMAKSGDQNAAAQAQQIRFDLAMGSQQAMTQLGAQHNQARASLRSSLSSSINQAAGVAQGFAGIASSMYQSGLSMRNSMNQYASNLRTQGLDREAQMIFDNPYSPVSIAPVFMAMMGYDMNPFTEGYSGMPESFLDGMNF